MPERMTTLSEATRAVDFHLHLPELDSLCLSGHVLDRVLRDNAAGILGLAPGGMESSGKESR